MGRKPPGARALGFEEPDLRVYAAHAWLEIGWDRDLSLAEADAWLGLGGGARLTAAEASLYIELELP